MTAVSDDVRRLLMGYYWPGNVRELQHAVEHAMNMVSGRLIELEHLPDQLRKHGREKAPVFEPDADESSARACRNY